MATNIDSILSLPVEERLEIMEKIWESLDENTPSIPSWHKEILEERFNRHKDTLTQGKRWEEVKMNLLK